MKNNAPAIAPPNHRLVRQIEAVYKTVADHYGFSHDEMTSRSRWEPLATQRQVAMFLAREATKAPYQLIALAFNRTDHATTMHAFLVVPNKMAQDRNLNATVETLRKAVSIAVAAVK